jgi:hypothetical protein
MVDIPSAVFPRELCWDSALDRPEVNFVLDPEFFEFGHNVLFYVHREAAELGLQVEKPSEAFYRVLRKIHLSYAEELKLLQPYSQQVVLGVQRTATYFELRGLVESAAGGYGFVSEGTLTKTQVSTPVGPQEAVTDQRTFEGWRKLT